jgi:translation initiation factor IF-1
VRARRARRRRTSSSPASYEPELPRRSYEWRGRRLEGAAIAGKEDKIEFEGEVIEAFRNGMYKILLDNGHETLGYTAGKMRRYRIKILPGDRVNVELSPYDLSRGRIVYRHR